MNDNVEKMKNLVAYLNKASDAYYNSGRPIMSDATFDQLVDELQALEDETGIVLVTSPTHKVGWSISKGQNTVKHSHPMLSLGKTKDEKEFVNYFGDKEWDLMWKADGLSISIRYVDGKYISAETRGNGIEGQDVTENVRQFANVPMTIPYKGEYIIDGEAIITYNDFEAINSKLPTSQQYANPRNLVSGTLSLLNSAQVYARKPRFYAWKVVKGASDKSLFWSLKEAYDKYCFDVVEICPNIKDYDDFAERRDSLYEKAKEQGIPIDGLVGGFDDMSTWEAMGNTGHHPKCEYALKALDDVYETTLKDIQWQIGKGSSFTPVAIFEPVQIEGSVVSKASLANVQILRSTLGIPYKGQKIGVSKRNMIIPKVEWGEIIPPENVSESKEEFILPPKVCPYCGHSLLISTDDVQCTNPHCSGKKLKLFSHFVSRDCINIDGMSDKTLEFLLNKGWIGEFYDIYNLDKYRRDWSMYTGWSSSSVNKLLNAIDKSRNVKLANFINALSIPGIDKAKSKLLADKFKHLDDLHDVLDSEYDFTNINTFGEVLDKNIHDWWDSEQAVVERLASEMNFDEPGDVGHVLDGMTFVITGKLHKFVNREGLVNNIEANGGKVVSSVSKNTTYLINNDATSQSSKNKKAHDLGVKIITEDEYMKMIGE